jgi:hypothetical protein
MKDQYEAHLRAVLRNLVTQCRIELYGKGLSPDMAHALSDAEATLDIQRPLYSFEDQDDLSNIPFGR